MLTTATSVPAYIVGGAIASAAASEEAEQAAYEEALADYQAAQARESAALDAAVAAYSAEREAPGGGPVPVEWAEERLEDRSPGLSDLEVAEAVRGDSLAGGIMGPSLVEAAAMEMWALGEPETEEAKKRIQAYEAAEREADAAESEWKVTLDRL